MITDEQLSNAIKSAEISASAWEVPFYVVITREDVNFGTGGQLRTVQKGNEWRSWDGQPTTPLLAVLP